MWQDGLVKIFPFFSLLLFQWLTLSRGGNTAMGTSLSNKYFSWLREGWSDKTCLLADTRIQKRTYTQRVKSDFTHRTRVSPKGTEHQPLLMCKLNPISLHLYSGPIHPAYPLHLNAVQMYVAFVFDEGCAFPLRCSAFQAEKRVFSLLYKANGWRKRLCTRASAVPNSNTGVTCVREQPRIRWCIVGREQWKAAPDICFQAHVPTEKKNDCPLQHPLNGWIVPITEAIKPFYEVFYWRHCTTCTVNMAVTSPWTSPRLSVFSPVGPDGKFFSEGLSTTA